MLACISLTSNHMNFSRAIWVPVLIDPNFHPTLPTLIRSRISQCHFQQQQHIYVTNAFNFSWYHYHSVTLSHSAQPVCSNTILRSDNEGQKCWNTSIKWRIFLHSECIYPLPLCTPHPLPSKPKSYINPPRLSSIINNIGAGRFTAFKQNQLLLSQIEV